MGLEGQSCSAAVGSFSGLLATGVHAARTPHPGTNGLSGLICGRNARAPAWVPGLCTQVCRLLSAAPSDPFAAGLWGKSPPYVDS